MMCDKPTKAVVEADYARVIEAHRGDGVFILIDDICGNAGIELTKQQARKFAKQILEMTGDEDE